MPDFSDDPEIKRVGAVSGKEGGMRWTPTTPARPYVPIVNHHTHPTSRNLKEGAEKNLPVDWLMPETDTSFPDQDEGNGQGGVPEGMG